MRCGECSGSGSCDLCDGYGCYPDSVPGAGDGPECDVCEGAGECAECFGSGETLGDDSEVREVDDSGSERVNGS